MFQSLSGFFRPCNRTAVARGCGEQYVSIPVGFFQALQLRAGGTFVLVERVSIPVGFFQALQHPDVLDPAIALAKVSIPVGFFQALQQGIRPLLETPFGGFQSLSGFFRPCNLIASILRTRKMMFQSLSGFFRPCNGAVHHNRSRPAGVSIPVGFFQALQHQIVHDIL